MGGGGSGGLSLDPSSPGVVFSQKRAPAARFLAATGLVKSRGGHFHGKKAPAARYIAATELVKVPTELVKVQIMAASWVSTTIR